jgi:hypothetical protein
MARGNTVVESSRRKFLKTAGVVSSTFVGASSAVAAQEDIQVIELTGYIPAWFGTRPKSIAGTLNPTLKLEAGQRYELRWTNGDGVGHDFIVRDQNGKWIAGTPLAFGTGSTESFRFTATEAMTSYYCTVHPVQMRGTIEVSGQTDEGPNTTVPKDVSPITEKSTVSFKEQSITDGKVTVESTTLPKGGFITIHTPRIKKRPRTVRDVKKSIVGWSEYLEPGTHKGISISVEKTATKFPKLIAMNHRDTNDNESYDFVTDGPQFADADWPYFTPKGRPVVSPAKIKSKGGRN